MSVQQSINPDHGWFAGEDKNLRFTLRDGVLADGWTCEFVLYSRSQTSASPVLTKTTGANEIVCDGPTITVIIKDTDTDAYEDRVYSYVLRRTDPDFENVLAYGPASIRQAAVA
jgi:hypothetical protein